MVQFINTATDNHWELGKTARKAHPAPVRNALPGVPRNVRLEAHATGGSGAAKLVAELSIDIAIVHINLNGEKSYPLATILASRRLPFVFSTGYGAAGLDAAWKHIPTISKPFLAHELADAISQAMSLQARPDTAGEASPQP